MEEIPKENIRDILVIGSNREKYIKKCKRQFSKDLLKELRFTPVDIVIKENDHKYFIHKHVKSNIDFGPSTFDFWNMEWCEGIPKRLEKLDQIIYDNRAKSFGVFLVSGSTPIVVRPIFFRGRNTVTLPELEKALKSVAI